MLINCTQEYLMLIIVLESLYNYFTILLTLNKKLKHTEEGEK